MTGFEGLENAGLIEGPQEKATREFIKEYRDGKAENPMADFIYSSMLSIARNIDVQNTRGREISRNMTSLLGYIQQLEGMYDTMDDDPEITELLGKAAR